MWSYAWYCLSESIEEEKNKGIEYKKKTRLSVFSFYLWLIGPEIVERSINAEVC